MTRASPHPDMTIREQAAIWWLRLRNEDALSTEEEDRLDDWLRADPSHAEALRCCADTWNALDALSDAPEIVARRANALEGMRDANRRRWARPGRLPRLRHAIAASLAILAIGTGAWLIEAQRPQNIATETGERRALVLDDGSHVSLDAKTRVSVALQKEQRRLKIDAGRAKFDVAYEPDRPFTVEAGGHIVVATGTSFSTEIVGGELRVIVYEGKVVVLNGAMPNPQTLLALRRNPGHQAASVTTGQELVVDGNGVGALRRDAPGSSSWEGGQLEFNDDTLADAATELNRYATIPIVVTDARAAGIRINGIFKAADSAAFLDAIVRMYPVTVRRSASGTIEIASRE
jgi:transmembrane sensor